MSADDINLTARQELILAEWTGDLVAGVERFLQAHAEPFSEPGLDPEFCRRLISE